MVQSTPVLVVVLLVSTLFYCSAENVYCVKPTAASCPSCPYNDHCDTLSEYAQEAELYFTSNTTMVFLPGHHTLNTNITVANASNLTMRSESSSGNRTTVVCNGAVGLSFTNMVGLKIYSLTFTSCSQKYIGTIPGIPQNVLHVALLLQYAQYAELVNCSFISNNSTALAVTNSNITIVGNNFIQNRALEHASYGIGAIFAYINAVLNFDGTNNFINNSARYGGTIVAYNNTVLRFSGTSNFIKNTARYGGAIFTYGNTVLNFSGISNFTDNIAPFGGAIYM